MEKLRDAQGVEFVPYVIQYDGTRCVEPGCGRSIRVRERAACYPVTIERRDDGAVVPSGRVKFRCRECLYREPINDFNRGWRKDACPKG